MPAQARRGPGFRVAGVPIRAPRGWTVVVAVLLGISVTTLQPDSESTSALVLWYLAAVGVTLAVTASLLAHELAHVFTARLVGGEVIAIDPPLFGALAEDAYVAPNPEAEAWVCGAGPVANLLLTALFGVAWLWLLPTGTLAADASGFVALINLVFAIASFLPGFPLDGGRILRAFIWYLTDDKLLGTKIASLYGQAIFLATLIVGISLLALGEEFAVWGAWLLTALWAINSAGREGLARTQWRETSQLLTVEDAGLAGSRRIDAGRTIDDAIDDLLSGLSEGPMLVTEDGQVVGVIQLRQLRRIPRSIWTQRHVRDISEPIGDMLRIPHDAPLINLLDELDRIGDALIIVEMRGRITGVVDRETAIQRIRSHIRSQRAERRRGRI